MKIQPGGISPVPVVGEIKVYKNMARLPLALPVKERELCTNIRIPPDSEAGVDKHKLDGERTTGGRESVNRQI